MRAALRTWSGRVGFGALLALAALGTYRAVDFEGRDFAVFHAAFTQVLGGRGSTIYGTGPDRFLYAPGFAYLFAPVGYFPEKIALVIFSVLKLAALIHLLMMVQGRVLYFLPLGILAWGALAAGRPLLIDFQYGQVNFLISWAVLMAILIHFGDHRSRKLAFLSWMVASVAAAAKLLALPVLLIPWLRRGRAGSSWERAGTLFGVGMMFFLPIVVEGWQSGTALLLDWRQALLSRGFPLETHNQSLPAFIYRVFGNSLSPFIAMEHKFDFSWGWLTEAGAAGWSLAIVLAVVWVELAFLVWPFFFRKDVLHRPAVSLAWAALLVASLIFPSHLVWKSYFVFGIALYVMVWAWALTPGADRVTRIRRISLCAFLFVVANFSGFQFVGYAAAARLESYCVQLWAHLGWLFLGAHVLRERLRA